MLNGKKCEYAAVRALYLFSFPSCGFFLFFLLRRCRVQILSPYCLPAAGYHQFHSPARNQHQPFIILVHNLQRVVFFFHVVVAIFCLHFLIIDIFHYYYYFTHFFFLSVFPASLFFYFVLLYFYSAAAPQRPKIEHEGVQVPPGHNVTVDSNAVATVSCVSHYGNPAANLKWFLGKYTLHSWIPYSSHIIHIYIYSGTRTQTICAVMWPEWPHFLIKLFLSSCYFLFFFSSFLRPICSCRRRRCRTFMLFFAARSPLFIWNFMCSLLYYVG